MRKLPSKLRLCFNLSRKDSRALVGPAFSAMAIGEDGLPVQIVCPLPDAFVAHKRAISIASGRKPLQRSRDAAQADAVEKIAPVLNATGAMYRLD